MLSLLLSALSAHAAQQIGSVGSVKYFGFWCPDEAPQMQGFTNIAFAKDAAHALLNKQSGIDTLLSLRGNFINTTVHAKSPGQSMNSLRFDYQERFAASVPLYRSLLANGTIIGFFLGDELLWNGLPLVAMEEYVNVVRATFPVGSAILYTNGAYPTAQYPTFPGQTELHGSVSNVPDENLWRSVPAGLDWFGIDAYPNSHSMAGWITLVRDWVLPKMAPHQSLVLIPPFYGGAEVSYVDSMLDCGDVDCDAAMTRWANITQGWVSGTAGIRDADRVAAIMPYHWVSLTPGGAGRRALGGKELPRARASWEIFGRAIVSAAAGTN